MRSQWDLKEAMRLYRRAIQENRDDVQLYHKALEIAPNDADLYVELADALVRKIGRMGRSSFIRWRCRFDLMTRLFLGC
jgi:hypothetical protein